MTYPGVRCPACGLRHELGLHKPHRPWCLACGAPLPWPNLDRLVLRVLTRMKERFMFCIAGFAGLDPQSDTFAEEVAQLQSFLQISDPDFPPQDALEVVAATLSLADFGRLACALDRWHAGGVGDMVGLEDLERRCAELEQATGLGDPRVAADLQALRQLQGLLQQPRLPVLCGEV